MPKSKKFPVLGKKNPEPSVEKARAWAESRPKASIPLDIALTSGMISERFAESLRERGVSWIRPA